MKLSLSFGLSGEGCKPHAHTQTQTHTHTNTHMHTQIHWHIHTTCSYTHLMTIMTSLGALELITFQRKKYTYTPSLLFPMSSRKERR